MIATDGVFSMDGDIAPIRQLVLAARLQQALVYVDDAHGIGVIGPDGRGSVAAAKEKGLLRSEGKEYVVKDGDMIYFRFNV